MARRFVPVVDVETPRLEREDNSAEYRKHRKFDNPFNISKDDIAEKERKKKEVCALIETSQGELTLPE